MTLRALIVDDEPVARRRLRALLESEGRVEVIGECEDGAAAIDDIRRSRPDVVFLDVQMSGLDGFDVVEALEPAEQPAIVFVTAYDRYAVRAFDVHAVDYLLKPFERARLRKTLGRLETLNDARDAARRVHAAVQSVRAQQPLRRVLVKSGGKVYAVRLDDVDSIQSAGHYLEMHSGFCDDLSGGRLARSETIRSRAIRPFHRSVIVNVDRIRNSSPRSTANSS